MPRAAPSAMPDLISQFSGVLPAPLFPEITNIVNFIIPFSFQSTNQTHFMCPTIPIRNMEFPILQVEKRNPTQTSELAI
jgi:hypothetical protein